MHIGQRVRLRRGRRPVGVIRHVGAVHFAAGDYVGIELGGLQLHAARYERRG